MNIVRNMISFKISLEYETFTYLFRNPYLSLFHFLFLKQEPITHSHMITLHITFHVLTRHNKVPYLLHG